MHKSAFEHMDQLSVEIAQRQKVSQHHHKLMQLSKFEEMEDMGGWCRYVLLMFSYSISRKIYFQEYNMLIHKNALCFNEFFMF